MAERKTERIYIPGKGWVVSGIGAAKGADDTSATDKAKMQDVTGLAALARKMREKRGEVAEPTARPTPAATPTPVPVSDAGPEDEARRARRLAAQQLQRRYGSFSLMGRG